MSTLEVYDPAMCCSTGVCGPSVDPKLATFAADLDWLQAQGVPVERFNLSQDPAAFAGDAAVRAALEAGGAEALPIVVVNGDIKSRAVYPTRRELATWTGVEAAPRSPAATAVPTVLQMASSSCCTPAPGQATTPASKSGGCS